jgi:ADP-ribose pyrophosphatase YjhB (NUDIX family)
MLWRRFDRRALEGCAMIIEDRRGRVLLVRHTYLEPQTWMLPAGRMGRRERPLAAAEREIVEEVGCQSADISLLEFEDAEFWGQRHRTYIYWGTTDERPTIDFREIAEAAFFPLSELPDLNEPTLERLRRWSYRRSFPAPVPAFVRPEYLEKQGAARPISLT